MGFRVVLGDVADVNVVSCVFQCCIAKVSFTERVARNIYPSVVLLCFFPVALKAL